jgi:glycosyltransferase involved in cell wall biosynthesis
MAMLTANTAIFLVNLVQDVNILRPLVFMAARDFGFQPRLLVSSKFSGRDLFGIWQAELEELAAETGAELRFFSNDWEAHQHLGGRGLIFSASESHLHNHVTTHSVFRHAPSSFVRVTIQHGFECVGFRHSADHNRAHGEWASFGADVVCSWVPSDKLTSMAGSQRRKLFVTGSTAILQMRTGPFDRDPNAPGIVCENLHSVRLNGAGDFKTEFVNAFSEFCRKLENEGKRVVLRPHPGGQYVLKNNVPLPSNAEINNAPIYRVDLRQYAYGISAPSSVLIDMLLAGIPTAVWRDNHGGMDADNYAGLTTVSTPAEWVDFVRSALADPEPYLRLQKDFLDREQLLLPAETVFDRFAELFRAVSRMAVRPEGFEPERERILFIANGNIPTLQLSFEKPLAPLIATGAMASELWTEQDMRTELVAGEDAHSGEESIRRHLAAFDPSVIVFCRYSGPAYEAVLTWAKGERVPVVYHIDDDLLSIPPDIGQRKFEHHNATERLSAVERLLNAADLVYASTQKLRERLLDYHPDLPVVAGKIYCAGTILERPGLRRTRKIGYMASADHAHNLEEILPAIERVLDENPQIEFELFGSIPVPPSLERFGERVTTAPPVADYEAFLREFADRQWDVGICPLTAIGFNLMKADTKWVEYTSAGAAVVASRGTVYDDCCANGCGLLANTPEEWFAALDRLVNDDEERLAQVRRAQAKLELEYSVSRLREQVLDVIDQARETLREHREDKEVIDCQAV